MSSPMSPPKKQTQARRWMPMGRRGRCYPRPAWLTEPLGPESSPTDRRPALPAAFISRWNVHQPTRSSCCLSLTLFKHFIFCNLSSNQVPPASARTIPEDEAVNEQPEALPAAQPADLADPVRFRQLQLFQSRKCFQTFQII